jgi:hypothetical protein
MADLHQLENKMRMLKLSGMVDTLSLRLDQAQKEGLAFSQFLEILLEDEIQHRSNKRLDTRIMRAHFEEEKIWKDLISISIPNYRPLISGNWRHASLSNVKNHLYSVVR